ncbi:MAG TPA: glycosyltransferase family 10 [Anaerolineaceae bacterium]|nr:glycosyltransferase family 10 [Anaerolineaceae bacterium]
MPITELHLAGAYGIKEILAYNRDQLSRGWNYPQFFPLWKACPNVQLFDAAEREPNPEAALLVINLNAKTWEQVAPRFDRYTRRTLLQLEAYQGWEQAYDLAARFDDFMNFDTVRGQAHLGFRRIYIPYNPKLASSHRDQRGWDAWLTLWRFSKHRFANALIRKILPRRKKAVMIAALGTEDRYQIRLRMARRWAACVDVYGRGWPKDLPNYRGVCINKLDILRQYRFALVFENQPQPGYVTEKLLDPFVAGTVPLYHGAPDANQDLPEGLFLPFDETTDCLDRWIKDDALYQQLRTEILQKREAALAVYAPERLMQTISEMFGG